VLIKDIREVFNDWKCNALLIVTAFCDWKCEIEGNLPSGTCQNSYIAKESNIEMSYEDIMKHYKNSMFGEALIFGGLEPILQFDDVYNIIKLFRENGILDDIVIYTGYYKEEIQSEIEKLKVFANIYFKFGRYIVDSEYYTEPIAGVTLASKNQYVEKISII